MPAAVSLLILDGAGPGVRASLAGVGAREAGRAGELAALAAELMAAAGPDAPEAVVAMVGPGSFTGLRAALALAHGLAVGSGAPLVAVAAAEAFAEAHPRRPLLAAFAGGRRGRYVVQRVAPDGACEAPAALDEAAVARLPLPDRTLVVGPAAFALAALLRGEGRLAEVDAAPRPPDAAIAGIARARLAGRLAARAALPLYADDLFAKA
jgi:tRNA threonylcarbamoyladenosine biosynthesis protein TsaB